MNHGLIFNINGTVMDRLGGAHRIASHLRNQGWDCEVIDFFNNWNEDELEELFKSRVTSNTKFIGLSYIFSLDAYRPEIKEFTAQVKKRYPNLLIISGSQTTLPDNENVDYHVTGYGEYALDSILKYHFSNGPAPKYDLTRLNYRTKVINALHNYPAYPLRDPIIRYEDRDFIHQNEWGKIEFSRGCKFKCTYCSYPILGVKDDHTRDVESARIQIQDAYDRFGIKNWIASDETFNDRTDKITKFADMVETLDFDPYFSGYIRADLLVSRPKDREELLRMRFLGHFYGIETFNHATAKSIKKGMDPKKLQEGILEVKKFFQDHVGHLYRGNMAFVMGLPHETIESANATVQWIKRNWIDQVATANPLQIGSLNDYRSSDLSLDYKKYGYSEIEDAKFPEYTFDRHNESVDDLLHKTEMMDKGIVWKNEHMDVFTAGKLARDVQNAFMVGRHNMSRLDPYLLSSIICNENGVPFNLTQKLKAMDHTLKGTYKNYLVFVDEYKRKKLSYKNEK